MRRSIAFAVGVLMASLVARADTYQFSISGAGVAPVIFALPSSPTPSGTASDYFEVTIPDSSITSGFTGTVGSTNILFPLGIPGNEFDLNILGGSGDAFFGPILYKGTIQQPTFLTGTFNLSAANDLQGNGLSQFAGAAATLRITDLSTPPPTPEPSSVLLLGTGLLAGAGVMRRRFAWR